MYVCKYLCMCVSWFEVSVGSCSGGWSHSIVWLMIYASSDDFFS